MIICNQNDRSIFAIWVGIELFSFKTELLREYVGVKRVKGKQVIDRCAGEKSVGSGLCL